MTARRPRQRIVPRIVIDSGGLSGLCGHSHSARTNLQLLRTYRGKLQLPAVVLAESTTGHGPRDAEVNRVLGVLAELPNCIVNVDEPIARRAGALRHAARSDDGIDAIVAAVAVGDGSPAVVLTSDPRDLERLLAADPQVKVRRV